MGYDRSQAKQEKKEKKGKKGGGGQSTARKKKHYSPDIPLRKVARMLEPGASSVKFVAQSIFEADRKLGAMSDMGQALNDLARNGAGGKYGASVQALAQKASEELAKLCRASVKAANMVIERNPNQDSDFEMMELERLTRPDPK